MATVNISTVYLSTVYFSTPPADPDPNHWALCLWSFLRSDPGPGAPTDAQLPQIIDLGGGGLPIS